MRILLTNLLTLLVVVGISARRLTPEESLARIDNLKATRSMRAIAKADKESELIYTKLTLSNQPAVYVFKSGNGFMMLSADDVANPLLGFAEEGEFDPLNMPRQMSWWLEQYSAQIDYASEANAPAYNGKTEATRAEAWAPVAPMVKAQWNQDEPFNLQCPQQGGKYCMAGCVATAMAQVMHYHQYPSKPTGSISYTAQKLNTTLTMNLSSQSFDWANMLDRYTETAGKPDYNSTQARAVAYLMKACGYAVNMNYGTDESGASPFYIGKSLIENFHYNSNLQYLQREFYTTPEWNQIIYKEVSEGRPVIYGGQSNGGGHEFVCDGYKDGYFHINWGWGGLSDGYFLLQALNPESLGIGGGSGGYNFQQSVTIGVSKTTSAAPELYMTILGSAYGEASGLVVTVKFGDSGGIYNESFRSITGKIGLLFKSLATGQETFVPTDGAETTLKSFYGYTKFSVNTASLPEGDYEAFPAFKNSNENRVIIGRVPVGCANGFKVSRGRLSASVQNRILKMLTIEKAEFETALYSGYPAKMSATVKNNTDMELTGSLQPVLKSGGNKVYVGDAYSLTLAPGDSKEIDWVVNFELAKDATAPKVPTNYTLAFIDKNIGRDYSFTGSAQMNINSGNFNISYKNLEIAKSVKSMATLSNGVRTMVYDVSNPAGFSMDVRLDNSGLGFFASKCAVFWFADDLASSSLGYTFLPLTLLAGGESSEFTFPVSFPAAADGRVYATSVFYQNSDGKYEQMKDSSTGKAIFNVVYFRINKSAIEEIEGSKVLTLKDIKTENKVEASILCKALELYDISGRKIASVEDSKTLSIPEGSRGVMIVIAVDYNGKRQTLKIIR